MPLHCCPFMCYHLLMIRHLSPVGSVIHFSFVPSSWGWLVSLLLSSPVLWTLPSSPDTKQDGWGQVFSLHLQVLWHRSPEQLCLQTSASLSVFPKVYTIWFTSISFQITLLVALGCFDHLQSFQSVDPPCSIGDFL